MNNYFKKLKNLYLNTCQKIVIIKNSNENIQRCFYLFLGIALLNFGFIDLANATQQTEFTIQDQQFLAIICAIVKFIEGAFGALIMIVAGIGAIVSAAFGQYKAALGLLAVAIGAFVLRALVDTFFGDRILSQCDTTGTGTAQ